MPFDEAERLVDEACEALFGETFDLIPITRPPNARPQPDSTRSVIPAFAGLFRAPGKRGAYSKSREAFETARAPGIQGSSPGVAVRRDVLAWAPRLADRVRRIKTGRIYEIVNIESFGLDSLDLILAETAP